MHGPRTHARAIRPAPSDRLALDWPPMRRALLTATTLLLATWPAAAMAAEPADPAEASAAEASAAATTSPAEPTPERTRLSPRKDRPWIERWKPEPNTTEVGVYGGLLVTSRRIELFEADFSLPDQGYRPFARVASSLGLRAGFFPMRFIGAEIEAGAMPSRTEDGQSALLYTARGAVVAQLALWSVTPFVLVGGGLVGVTSDRTAVGNDVDAAMHVGGGVKVYLGRFTHVRLDVRDVVTARRGYEAGLSNNPEILLGFGMTIGRRRDLVYREPKRAR
jgi:OOP family OmpA-OmpF porin